MPPRVQSSFSYTPKTTIPIASGHEFQGKKSSSHIYERIKKREKGRGKT
jgi:hypothetical protein